VLQRNDEAGIMSGAFATELFIRRGPVVWRTDMSRSIRIGAVCALALIAPVQQVRGQFITFRFDGRVTDVLVEIPDYWETPNIDWPDVGTPFTGFYTFDPTAPDTAGSAEQGAYHVVLDDVPAVDVSVGDLRLQGASTSVATYASIYEAGDWIPRIELVSHPEEATLFNRNSFQLSIRKDGLLPGPILPLAPPPVIGAESARLSLWLDNGLNTRPYPYVSIAATLDSLTAVRPGDFNGDGTVDAADYALWRDRDGSPHGYDAWRVYFGKTAAGAVPSTDFASVPEPATAFPMAMVLATLWLRVERRSYRKAM
jgi:hypothetical protein